MAGSDSVIAVALCLQCQKVLDRPIVQEGAGLVTVNQDVEGVERSGEAGKKSGLQGPCKLSAPNRAVS